MSGKAAAENYTIQIFEFMEEGSGGCPEVGKAIENLFSTYRNFGSPIEATVDPNEHRVTNWIPSPPENETDLSNKELDKSWEYLRKSDERCADKYGDNTDIKRNGSIFKDQHIIYTQGNFYDRLSSLLNGNEIVSSDLRGDKFAAELTFRLKLASPQPILKQDGIDTVASPSAQTENVVGNVLKKIFSVSSDNGGTADKLGEEIADTIIAGTLDRILPELDQLRKQVTRLNQRLTLFESPETGSYTVVTLAIIIAILLVASVIYFWFENRKLYNDLEQFRIQSSKREQHQYRRAVDPGQIATSAQFGEAVRELALAMRDMGPQIGTLASRIDDLSRDIGFLKDTIDEGIGGQPIETAEQWVSDPFRTDTVAVDPEDEEPSPTSSPSQDDDLYAAPPTKQYATSEQLRNQFADALAQDNVLGFFEDNLSKWAVRNRSEEPGAARLEIVEQQPDRNSLNCYIFVPTSDHGEGLLFPGPQFKSHYSAYGGTQRAGEIFDRLFELRGGRKPSVREPAQVRRREQTLEVEKMGILEA